MILLSDESIKIDKVKGVVIAPNGVAHSFGHCLMIPKEIETTHERHESCFKNEILASDWFKNNNVKYDYNHYYYSQIDTLTSQGFSLIQNSSCTTDRGNRSISYIVALSKESLSNQEEYIKSIYPQINKIITNEEKTYFELALYSEGIPLIDMLAESIEELDEFYEKIGLDIEKTEKIAKSI